MAEADEGVLIYLAQEGRDIGLLNKLRAYSLQENGMDTVEANENLGFNDDERLYYPAKEILTQLNIKNVELMKRALDIKPLTEEIKEKFRERLMKLGDFSSSLPV